MPKTKQELDQLKQEYESLVSKLKELDEDEIDSVSGGTFKPGLQFIQNIITTGVTFVPGVDPVDNKK